MTKRIPFTILVIALLLGTLCAEEERPKIGLVLGGGGALGFAHVGVLQVMEELQIPIDYIGGTSMGAIVAGMYASGMSPAEMERQFTTLNWWEVLKDRSPHPFLDYRRKVDDKRLMGMEFGLKDWRVVFSPGVAYGQKLNNVLETFSINSVGITDFDQLNIPYRAVATDLRSGSSVTLKSGNLAEAMRASMAVPGAFTPVRMDGMVLVDGGVLNNVPVEAIKKMGADIIIAIDVGASSAAESADSDFSSLGDVVGRTYTLMRRPDQKRQLAMADLVIAPDLTDASPSQFHRAKEIIPAGRKAAEELRRPLSQYSTNPETFHAYLEKQRFTRNGKILVTDIEVTGNKTVSEAIIRSRIKAKKGPLLLETVCDDLRRIHGMGDFQTVTYNLSPTNSGYRLEYKTIEKFWGPTYLHFGIKLETTTDAATMWSLLLNYTRTQLNPLGGELRVDLEGGGRRRYALGEWYQPVSRSERFFLASSAFYLGEDIDYYIEDTDVADIDQHFAGGALDTGINFFEYGEFRIGLLGGYAIVEGNSGTNILSKIDDAVVAATTRLRVDQLDDPVFPSAGYRIELDGMFAFEQAGSDETFSRLQLQAVAPYTIGRHTIEPKLSIGSSQGTDLPFYASFDMGGLDSFAGMAPYQLRGDYYGLGSLGYRYRLGRLPPALGNGLYALLRGDAGNTWFSSADMRFDDLNYGVLAGLGADTILGSCTIAIGKAESIRPHFYFSIGNTF
ncbi:MAG: patatin-like phospholipase family protein [Verrucomicrobiota bacterium]